MVDNRQSYVMYESVYKQIIRLKEKLGSDAAMNYFNAVCEYGLYGVIPEDDDVNWLYGLEQTFTSIGVAKDRYNASVENGRKGGRPRKQLQRDEVMEQYYALGTWKAVAKHFGVSDDTLRNARKQWEAEAERPEKPKNPNDNVNVNVNVNDNVNENETIPSVSFRVGEDLGF